MGIHYRKNDEKINVKVIIVGIIIISIIISFLIMFLLNNRSKKSEIIDNLEIGENDKTDEDDYWEIVSVGIGKSVNETQFEHGEFANKIGVPNISLNLICKVFNKLRRQIKINAHLKWNQPYLDEEIDFTGYPSLEIDESKIIGNSNTVYWMF